MLAHLIMQDYAHAIFGEQAVSLKVCEAVSQRQVKCWQGVLRCCRAVAPVANDHEAAST